MSYDHIYVEYDELSSAPVFLGPKCIRCQCCGKEVQRRHYMEIDIKSEPARKEKVLAMVRLSNYRRVPMALSDGTVIYIHMCSTCERNDEIDFNKDETKSEKITNQIKEQFMNDDRFYQRPEADVVENSKRWDKIKAVRSFKSDVPFKQVLERSRQAAVEYKEKKRK